jgi:histidinol phosphatase-like enzyme
MHSYRSPFAPLEGTTPAPRALFIDRWGTLLEPPREGFARVPADVRFVAGAVEALFRAARAGWKLYLIGNEEAVAFGHQSMQDWQAIEDTILGELGRAGIPIGKSYACTEHPRGSTDRQNDSVYLLPNTGAFYHAHHTDGVDLGKSWVVGDSTLELVAGWRAGVRLAAVRTGAGLDDRTFEVDPELFEDDLCGVVRELLTRTESLHH